MTKIKKILSVLKRSGIVKISYLSETKYMNLYIKYLKQVGVIIKGMPKYISPDAYIDGKDYSLISIGDNVTISREVMLLTHDYSLTNAVSATDKYIRRGEGELYTLKGIIIDNNAFIGARASILPGTHIGENVIVGAGAVVKGNIPPNSIIIGNPAHVVKDIKEYSEEILKSGEFFRG